MSDICTINTDGGSRGNPGPAAFGYTLKRPGEPDIEESGYLGHKTNNFAEYTAVLRSLEHAAELGVRVVLLLSDSELMVKQMNGIYQVKNANILPLYQEIKKLLPRFDKVTFKHIYREENSHADDLCNKAMDDAKLGIVPLPRIIKLPAIAEKAGVPPVPLVKEKKPAKACPSGLREKGIGYLRELQDQWADEEGPSPEDVWAKIWDMIHAK